MTLQGDDDFNQVWDIKDRISCKYRHGSLFKGVELETLHKKSDVWAAGQLTFFVAENNKKYPPPHTHLRFVRDEIV